MGVMLSEKMVLTLEIAKAIGVIDPPRVGRDVMPWTVKFHFGNVPKHNIVA